jgi:ureidoglycolate dehydrogenase (NAD+)
MACAVSSWGKVQSLGMYGESIPAGWALDAAGNPTTDSKAAKTLLPAAGARGYGLAFVSSILAGTLVGGKMPLHKTRSPEVEGSEHFFYVLDIKQFVEPERFYDEIEQTMAGIRALAPAQGSAKVTLPGDLEWERAERWSRNGIPLHKDHLRELSEAARRAKVETPW